MQKREIGLLSGSFNPIHNGHLMLAEYLSEFTYLEEVWFVVTPQNPLKDTAVLIDDDIRMAMVEIALEGYDKFKVSDVEFHLPKPSYTINTLKKLSKENRDTNFSLIIGSDNWIQFDKWRNYKEIINSYKVLIYPRNGYEPVISEAYRQNVQFVDAPQIEVSSTFIRNSISEGKSMRSFLPNGVYEYIDQNRLYR